MSAEAFPSQLKRGAPRAPSPRAVVGTPFCLYPVCSRPAQQGLQTGSSCPGTRIGDLGVPAAPDSRSCLKSIEYRPSQLRYLCHKQRVSCCFPYFASLKQLVYLSIYYQTLLHYSFSVKEHQKFEASPWAGQLIFQ